MSITKMILPIFVLLSACSTVVDIKVPKDAPKHSINAIFGQDSVLRMSVNETVNILDADEFQDMPIISNANITVYDEFNAPFDVLYFDDGKYVGTKSLSGKKFSVKVDADGIETTASCVIPEPVAVTYAKLDTTRDSEGHVNLKFKFRDPSETKDYYQIYIIGLFNNGPGGLSQFLNHIEIKDPAYAYAKIDQSEGWLINDDLFNGKEATFTVNYYGFDATVKNIVYLFHVSPEYYQYYSSKNLQAQTDGDPLAQPTQVFCNVNNGLGIFAGYSVYRYEAD